jgi:hypothetical protein
MGRRGGTGFVVRLLFLVRSLVRAAVCRTGVLPAVRARVLSRACRVCAAAVCPTGRLRAGGLCASTRRRHLAAILPHSRMLSVRSI